MKKNTFIYILLLIIIIAGFVYYLNNTNYFSLNNATNDISNNQSTENSTYNTNTSINVNEQENTSKTKSIPKVPISSYQTKIQDNSEGRLANIQLTCSIINGTIIKPGEEFSFNNIVGKPSSERGYKIAKIIVNGHSEDGIGGRKLSSK